VRQNKFFCISSLFQIGWNKKNNLVKTSLFKKIYALFQTLEAHHLEYLNLEHNRINSFQTRALANTKVG